MNEAELLRFLIQILLLLGCARALGELFRRWGQPAVIGELLVGVVFGPSILGQITALQPLFDYLFPAGPEATWKLRFETIAEFGVLFLLLANGLEVDVSVVWRQRKEATIISVSDVFLPLIAGFIMALFIPSRFMAGVDPNRYVFAYLVGTAVTIGALPVAVRALHDINILRTDIGLLILSALTANDIIGWVLFTIAVGLAIGEVSVARVFTVLFFTLGFTAACMTFGRILVDRALKKLNDWPVPQPGSSLTFVVLVGILGGAITTYIGIHALFGFFMAGIMAGDSDALSERSREIISQMVYSIFVPLFFVNIGLQVDFVSHFHLGLALLITAVCVGGRYAGAWLGSLGTSVAKKDRGPIAVAHTAGGAMAIVVALLALQEKVVTEEVFVAVVFSAILSSITLGPWLTWTIRRRQVVKILDFFRPKLFVTDMKAVTRYESIRELAEAGAADKTLPDAETIAAAVIDREKMQSTATGQGIAFPHARMEQVSEPRVLMGLSMLGTDWDAPDGLPVRWVFLVLTPADDLDSQLVILSSIARVIMQPQVKSDLLLAKDSSKAWSILKQALSPAPKIQKQQTQT